MAKRLDLLSECNGNAAPIDVFTTECCARCINPECTRSQFGTSKFDQRVSTWFQRLFEEVPRMDPRDPRFTVIAGQKFQIIDVSRVPEVNTTSAWLDPRDLDKPQAQPLAPSVPSPPVVDQPAVVQVQVAAPVEAPPPAGGSKSLLRHMVLANTPAPPPQTLKPMTPSTAQTDRWAGPLPSPAPEKSAPVVKPGATVKLGGSGV